MKWNAHNYQRQAVDFVIDHSHALLALDMGLGKTVSVLTAIAELREQWCEPVRAMVVAPKTVAETTWAAEASKWDHLSGLTVALATGDAKRRRKAVEAGADVTVIGRDNLVWLLSELGGAGPFNMAVLDELTSFKNRGSSRFKAFAKVRGAFSRIIGLTGTPAPNGLLDLWAQMYCIDGGAALGKRFTAYRDRYFWTVEHNHIVIRAGLLPGSEEAITAAIAPVTLTMRSIDHLSLPECTVVDTDVTLAADVLRRYRVFEAEKVMEFMAENANQTQTVMAASAAALAGKLSQWASGTVYDEDQHPVAVHSAKLEHLVSLVEAAQSPVLVFYGYRSDIARIFDALKGYRVELYTGAETLERWNAGDIDVLLAHPASTAYGLNMQQGGHYIVWYTLPWNLELYQQANARLHRQGQRHPVTIYRLIACDTIDRRIAAALDAKDTTQSALLLSLKELYEANLHN